MSRYSTTVLQIYKVFEVLFRIVTIILMEVLSVFIVMYRSMVTLYRNRDLILSILKYYIQNGVDSVYFIIFRPDMKSYDVGNGIRVVKYYHQGEWMEVLVPKGDDSYTMVNVYRDGEVILNHVVGRDMKLLISEDDLSDYMIDII